MWFILFVSILNVFHSMFLNDGRVVFHYSWFSLHFPDLSLVLVIMFLPGCLVVYRLEVWCFHFPKLAVLFRRIVFVFHHLVCLLLYYSFVYMFLGGFLVFQGQKINPSWLFSNLIGKPLASCLKFRTFLPDFDHSFPVSSLWRVAPKITLQCKLIIFPSSYFVFRSLIVVVSYVVDYVPEKKSSQHS